MPKQIIIAEQHRIAAVFSEDQIQELIVATGSHQIGDIYLGVVENVLPGIDAAFVNIGDSERNGFIHVTDLGPLRLKRSAGAITELLTPQQKVLVQVMKEPTGNKGPRLTGNITLPGRYLVLMPFGRGVNLSRRIRNEAERNRLRALAILIKPAGMGLLVRTEAEGMAEEAILEDLESLQKQWETIQQETTSTRAPALLNRDDDFIQRVLRDMYTTDVNRIVVDSHTGLKRVKQHLLSWSGGRPPQGVLIDHHRERIPVLEYFRVNAAIREAVKPRVDLPSGGYIIIEPTEALTVIDVNSGSFTRSATARETVLWTNCEAATEIARQMRLRNIAGVIIVDFIDMESRRDQLQVLEHFNKALRADKARPQIAQLSELGLVELTRKRQGQNIYELFGRNCPTCGGLGHLVHLPGETENSMGEIVDRTLAPRDLAGEFRGPELRRSVDPSGYGRRGGKSSSATVEAPYGKRGRPIPPSAEPPALSESDFAATPNNDWDTHSSEFEAEGGDQDLDMLNHPSYQERGGNNRRRRRRRPGMNEDARPGGFERTEPREKRGESPLPGRRLRETPLPEPKLPVAESTPEPVSLPAAPVSEGSPGPAVDAPAPVGREGWTDRPERTKPTRRENQRSAPQPAEVITVEMTPEEQDVYAVMGVSPLVLANRDVKEARSAVITVVLPGQAGQASQGTAPVFPPSAEEAIAPSVKPELPVKTPPVTLPEPTPQPEPVTTTESASLEPENPVAEAQGQEPEDSGLPNRRRRRRSSAQE